MIKEILIAGSGRAEREEFQRMFETTGYHLIFPEKEENVLLKVKELKPDVIIAGNSDLCEDIKRDPGSKDIPLIFLSSIFDETPEGGRRRVPADGVLSKPFYEDEVLSLVNRLTEKRGDAQRAEEEIIELVDVVEEPERGMSIEDFVGSGKEESPGEVLPLESWGKIEEEEREVKPYEKGFDFSSGKAEKGVLKEEEVAKEAASEGDFFEKIELDEILQKVDDLKPFFEREWPEEIELKAHKEEVPKVERREPLESVLKKETETEETVKEIEPLALGKRKPEAAGSFDEIPVEEMDLEALAKEALESLSKEETLEEELPEELLEEVVQEEEISVVPSTGELEEESLEIEEVSLKPEEVRWEPEEIRLAPERFESGNIGPQPGKMWPEFEEERPIAAIKGEVPQETEKVLSDGIREITEEFITKLVSQLTQHIITLTVERIEKTVREIVPDLAEKAIQEEIERLQREIKK